MVTRADMRNRLRWELGDETQPYVWKDLELNEYIDSSVQLLTTHVPRTRCRVVNPDPADGAYYLPEDCIGPPWRVDMDGQVLPPSAYFLPDDHILMLEPMGTRGVRPIAVTYPACVFPPGDDTTPLGILHWEEEPLLWLSAYSALCSLESRRQRGGVMIRKEVPSIEAYAQRYKDWLRSQPRKMHCSFLRSY
ncbi:hypothetical protein Tter_1767 [Thermobaculum terrenum ATCC BAA-798]|uniref:Uncharacterized protein n=1 Tax=Thermobaculum terrenum (strain ATCC BAA-798 / CCMEE 7001 / YNP1) TaxID=525904 RepID=D1CD08_THET1|nr:hypothetical protein [Thermobaculum terrenum]ACZ42673.1 hypothetical protein Tter_1767 [Thermobaculum terrenum ATCC BAA-798]